MSNEKPVIVYWEEDNRPGIIWFGSLAQRAEFLKESDSVVRFVHPNRMMVDCGLEGNVRPKPWGGHRP